MNSINQKTQIQTILSHQYVIDKNNKQVLQYKILWKGPTCNNCTWQRVQNLQKFKAKIEIYNKQHLNEKEAPKIKEDEQQFDEQEYNKWRGRKKTNYTRGIEGRAPANNLPRPYKGPDKNAIARSNIQQVKNQPDLKAYMRLQQQRKKRNIKIQGLFREIPSDKICFKVRQNNTLTYRTRHWIMQKSMLSLIQFYESLIRPSLLK